MPPFEAANVLVAQRRTKPDAAVADLLRDAKDAIGDGSRGGHNGPTFSSRTGA